MNGEVGTLDINTVLKGETYTYNNAGVLDYSEQYGEKDDIKTTYLYEYWDSYKKSDMEVSNPNYHPGYSKY